MATSVRRSRAVLIIERDEAIRKMLSIVLKRAGFSIRTSDDLDGVSGSPDRVRFDAVICDVDLAPAHRKASVQQLAALHPEVLRRMIVTTTASERVVRETIFGLPFAVVRKPFDVDQLVCAVRDCASAAEELPPRKRGAVENGRHAHPVNLRMLQHFVASIPVLRDVLRAPAPSQYELLLRGEMRQTILELSDALHQAAEVERNRTRAAAYLAASVVAAELVAASSQPQRPSSRSDH